MITPSACAAADDPDTAAEASGRAAAASACAANTDPAAAFAASGAAMAARLPMYALAVLTGRVKSCSRTVPTAPMIGPEGSRPRRPKTRGAPAGPGAAAEGAGAPAWARSSSAAALRIASTASSRARSARVSSAVPEPARRALNTRSTASAGRYWIREDGTGRFPGAAEPFLSSFVVTARRAERGAGTEAGGEVFPLVMGAEVNGGAAGLAISAAASLFRSMFGAGVCTRLRFTEFTTRRNL